MTCLGILWNSIQENLPEILEDISAYGHVLEAVKLNLNDEYENFVRDIYSQDEIAEWKVDKKIETMFQCSESREITIVLIDIETTEIIYHDLKKRNVFVNLENMKTSIRNKYSKIVNYYFFDNIFHVTDDIKEYIADLKVVKTYISRGIKPIPLDFIKQDNKILRKVKE